MTTYWCEYAWLPDGLASGVRIEIERDEIRSVTPDSPRTENMLYGLVVPGFANAHSHAFHRALRGRTHHDRGTFWTWREKMYALAEKLDPDNYYSLARGVFAEMALAGYTCVGEFHYLHHPGGGKRHDPPHEMAHALVSAAEDAAIRLTLLDTCYLAGGFGRELDPVQERFSDGDVDAWAERVDSFEPETPQVVVGAAVHSVRAVPAEALGKVAEWAKGRPLHVHLSEQRAENEECLSHHGRTPTALLDEHGVLGEHTVAVHATHLTKDDIALLGRTGTGACFCPTTERDLGDGIGPARALADAGVRLSLGSDSHAIVDPWEEARALEMNERLGVERRGRFTVAELMGAANNYASIGWPQLGRLAPGAGADLVRVDLENINTAGIEPEAAVFAATAADVTDVMVAGRWSVRDGRHQNIRNPRAVLNREIGKLWQQS
ncbi:formimidoylglutamate deiminase [Amycolatopsis anabasis]|uniref:formimidoylglutamate deiminase n=1 Tax=Amycolatopsis anabasis TaxID=1840409 RepID=UPI00131C9CC6|nr:formimidoylglutamate deiminase [Amycolatopsis anabasis]